MLEANIDAYGTYADASALADFLELLALKGTSISEVQLSEFMEDNEWGVSPKELFSPPVAADEEDPEGSEAAAARVFSLLLERASILGDQYPFTLTEDGLTPRPGLNPQQSAYIALLSITIAHAYKVQVNVVITQVFEQTVADVLSENVPTINFSAIARAHNNFDYAVLAMAEQLNFKATPWAALKSMSANDCKVDTVCHAWWGDDRPGHWVALGQVTCAMSDEWGTKITEPPMGSWKGYLGILTPPVVFLAVPHHVEPKHLSTLVQDYERVILDRLRLAKRKTTVQANELQIIQAVLALEIAKPNAL